MNENFRFIKTCPRCTEFTTSLKNAAVVSFSVSGRFEFEFLGFIECRNCVYALSRPPIGITASSSSVFDKSWDAALNTQRLFQSRLLEQSNLLHILRKVHQVPERVYIPFLVDDSYKVFSQTNEVSVETSTYKNRYKSRFMAYIFLWSRWIFEQAVKRSHKIWVFACGITGFDKVGNRYFNPVIAGPNLLKSDCGKYDM